jgi:hypothetical protein
MNDKIDKIKKWINKGGFPFEMKVAKAFKKSDFQIGQSIMFKDVDTEKYRETDIIAHVTKGINNVWFNLTFVIECKKIIGKPWVVLKSDSPYQIQKGKLPIYGSRNAQILIKQLNENKQYRSPFIFPDLSDYGYNVVTAFSEKNDTSYSASQSVIKATEYLVTKSNESNNRFCNIYIPIIAVDGELYEGRLNNDSEIELEQKNVSTFVSTKSFEENGLSILTVVTSSEIENYVKQLKKDCDLFFKNYKKELEDISKSNPTNLELTVYDNDF